MEHLSTLLGQPLAWTILKDTIILKSNDEIVLELKEVKSSKATFSFDGIAYCIRNEGFWNPKTIVEKEGKQLLVLKRHFLGKNGTIQFESGKSFACKVRNSPLVKIAFLAEDGQEILNYKLEASLNPNSVKSKMTLSPSSVPGEELLMLIVLGCFAFKGIMKENSDNDFIVMAAGA